MYPKLKLEIIPYLRERKVGTGDGITARGKEAVKWGNVTQRLFLFFLEIQNRHGSDFWSNLLFKLVKICKDLNNLDI